MKNAPPKLAQQILRWFVNAEFVEEIEGDLQEIYDERLSSKGRFKANLFYFLDVMRAVRPYHPRHRSSLVAHEIIHAVFFRLALRNLAKRKTFGAVTIFGLSVGLISFFLIMEYVTFERRYDSFHIHGDKIYRVAFNWGETDHNGENSSIYASSVPALGPALAAELPEIEAFTRFVPILTVKPYCVINSFEQGKLRYTGNADRGFYADSVFLKIFSFPVIAGREDPLSQPNAIAITRSYATKIFGHDDIDKIIGASLEVDARQKEEHLVTAVLEDVPANSHIQFDYLISYSTINSDRLEGNLGWSQFYTYVLTKHVLSNESVAQKFKVLIEKLYGRESHISIFLQPLKEIYLHPSLREEAGPKGSSQQLVFLTVIAYAILLMGWINYINMFLARSMERANEIGVKKVLGSTRIHLAVQFFAESLILNVISFSISILLLLAIQQPFESWLGKSVSDVLLNELPFFTTVVIAVFLGSLAAGLYPAVLLASHAPITVIQQKFQSSRQGLFFKKSLLYFQFIVSFVMVASTLIINKQIDFMKKADLGMELNGCVALRSPGSMDSTYADRIKSYKERLLKFPFVENVTSSSSIPGKAISISGGVQRVIGPELDGNNVFFLKVDENFLQTYDLRLVAGKNFSPHFTSIPSIIINETALKTLRFDSPNEALHHRVHWQGKEYEVIGVFADYNHLFLKETFEPIILSFNPATTGYITLKVQDGYYEQALTAAKSEMQSLFPFTPFEYSFLEAVYDHQYYPVQQFEWLAKYFAILAIVIACLGLFALSYYSVQKRVREIAVRKVFGAGHLDLLFLLSKKYLAIVALSALLGAVITFYCMEKWLQNFAFSVGLNAFDFLLPLATIASIVFITVGYNSLRTSFVNPTKSLKHH